MLTNVGEYIVAFRIADHDRWRFLALMHNSMYAVDLMQNFVRLHPLTQVVRIGAPPNYSQPFVLTGTRFHSTLGS